MEHRFYNVNELELILDELKRLEISKSPVFLCVPDGEEMVLVPTGTVIYAAQAGSR
jgi:hypothetical protein